MSIMSSPRVCEWCAVCRCCSVCSAGGVERDAVSWASQCTAWYVLWPITLCPPYIHESFLTRSFSEARIDGLN
jgi:hypothetical protein